MMEIGKHPLKLLTATICFFLCWEFISLAHGSASIHESVPSKYVDDNDLQLPLVNPDLLREMRKKRSIHYESKMRQRRQATPLTRLNFVLLMPYENSSIYNLPLTQAAVSLAFYTVKNLQLLPSYDLGLSIKNSQCSPGVAMNEAIDAYISNQLDVFLGPVCDYALAPVARQSTFWRTPVITPGGFADDFDNKKTYPLLVRSGMNLQSMANMTASLMDVFQWKKLKVLYDPDGQNNIMDLFCHTASASLAEMIASDPSKRKSITRVTNITSYLNRMESDIGNQFAVVVLCLNGDDVREVMIKAHELGYDDGKYVFINIDLFSSQQSLERPWYRSQDTDERNTQAQKGFQALMTLTLRKPSSEEYRMFSQEVKTRAKAMSPIVDVDEEEVNFFVGAFHDSVLLYALALNETLGANLERTNSTAITQQMKDRTFEGITGTVHIRANGARDADFSLLDLNPNSNKFEVVSNYYGSTGHHEFVAGKAIDWGGGVTTPPRDTPVSDSNDTKVAEEKQECSVGFYGSSCDLSCSVNCAGRNHPCNPVNGSCEQGCVAGYQGDVCSEKLIDEEKNKGPGQDPAYIVVTVAIGIIVVVAAFIVGCLLGRRRSSSRSHSNQEEDMALNAVKS